MKRTKRMRALVICAAVHVAAMALCSERGGYISRLGGIREICREMETASGDANKLRGYAAMLARSDGMNVAGGFKESLGWARKYAALYPPKDTESLNSEGSVFSEEGSRRQIFAYLALKGDARDLEVVKRFNSDILGALLERRVAGENIFGYDAGKLKPLGFQGRHQTFFPSVINTGPQAVYVREILYRYWEETGRDKSKMPDELLRMVVLFDAYYDPVCCNVDLAKYGLSMPAITPKPNWDMFSIYGEGVFPDFTPLKYTVKFPDLAEPVEVSLDMDRDAPEGKGLYEHVKKIPPPAQQ